MSLKDFKFTYNSNGWIENTEENCRKMTSPQHRNGGIKRVIILDKQERWTLAHMLWEGRNRLATRWFWSKLGEPNSRGYPTWHILPDELAEPLLRGLLQEGRISKNDCDSYIKKLGKED